MRHGRDSGTRVTRATHGTHGTHVPHVPHVTQATRVTEAAQATRVTQKKTETPAAAQFPGVPQGNTRHYVPYSRCAN